MFDIAQFATAPSGRRLEIVEEVASCLSKQEIEKSWEILRTHWRAWQQTSADEKRRQWKIGDTVEFHSSKTGGMVRIRITRLNLLTVSGLTDEAIPLRVGYERLRRVVA